MGRIASLIIAVLLVVAASLGYAYQSQSNELKDAKAGLLQVSNTALFCLSDMDALETMLENNVSDDAIQERVSRYEYCASVLNEASLSLYGLGMGDKYRKLSAAASNLEVYFHTVMRDPRGRISREDLEVLDEISMQISQISQNGGVKGLSDAQAERLFNLTQSLSD